MCKIKSAVNIKKLKVHSARGARPGERTLQGMLLVQAFAQHESYPASGNAPNAALLNPQELVRFKELLITVLFSVTMRNKAIPSGSMKYVCSWKTANDQLEIRLVIWPSSSMQCVCVQHQSAARNRSTTDWMM